jgi:uncharacterized protein YndB with AHSA1/START domain
MTTDLKNELTIVRVLDAPRARVWRAFREIDALKQWWGLPDGATMPSCTVDFRLGGAMHCQIEAPGGPEVWFKWIYREIVEGERFVLEQHFSDTNGRELDSSERPVSTITLSLEDMNGKTKLTVVHSDMASEKFPVEDYEQGWSESLSRLAVSLALA